MQPKLKENPREWQKFTAVMVLMVALVCVALHRRGMMHTTAMGVASVALILVVLASLVRPQSFRGFYRSGMTVSFHVGQVMGGIMLSVFFLLALTPLGLFLRLFGKDLLELKRDPAAKTYWRPARNNPNFDRMF
jgi:hypothetical protein